MKREDINMSAQNLTLLTDLYELTMMQGYFETQENQTVVFDVFFRDNPNKGGYSVMAGLGHASAISEVRSFVR